MKFLTILLFIITPLLSLGNACAPGFWNAGSATSFKFYYSDDEYLYQNIQMVKEKISIDLYQGFAVVQGEYWMLNHLDSNFTVNVGYPINSNFHYWINETNEHRVNVNLDTLHALEISINGKVKPDYENIENHFVWSNFFTSKDTTKINVRFIINTNETSITEGYNKDETNGFVYILESGAYWKQPIINGEIRIRLNDLNYSDLKGISPDSVFLTDKKNNFIYSFNNITPTHQNNIVIAYSQKKEEFSISNVLSNKQIYYHKIQKLSSKKYDLTSMSKLKTESPFKVYSSSFFGPYTIILIIFIFIGIMSLIVFYFAVKLIMHLIEKRA